uniref:DSBA-like thioredoxin domain-containing protein n=1 Tax=Meloidogyne javanica TaxID=6303 RepID=A0A915LG93_MELJA
MSSIQKPLLKLYYDIGSPYSWVAFESLLRYEKMLNIQLELLPVSIGHIFKATKEFINNSTLNPPRFLTAVKLNAPEYLIDASREYWMKAWSQHEPFYGIDTIIEICNKLNIPEEKNLLEATQSTDASNLLKERTNEVLKLGAFGLPWITLKRNISGNEEIFSFWGSDRLPIICDLLGKEFYGPLKENKI